MSVATKFLYGAVGLIVTILLIYAGLNVYNRAKNMSDYVSQEQDQSLANSKEYAITKYDGYKVNGSTAINYIKTVITDNPGMTASIIKGSGASKTTGVIQYTSDFTAMRDVTDSLRYVNPLKEYVCKVVRDANDAIIRVEITEQ